MSRRCATVTAAGAAPKGIPALACVLSLWSVTTPAHAWADEGHEIIALIADHYLDPAVRTKVNSLLAADTTKLTPNTRIDMEATWADKFRDSDRNSTRLHYQATRKWHYVNLELSGPDLKSACFGQPSLKGAPASNGPADDCIVDKIDEFAAELKSSSTGDQERLYALQFLLHLVGDIHQPLHASDNHDRGGNEETVTTPGVSRKPDNLHAFWDTRFVTLQGRSKTAIANKLIAHITDAQRAHWSSGTPADWANESFAIARGGAYGMLPAPASAHHYTLPKAYVIDAKAVVAQQLSKAGVRLAFVLNSALQ